MWELVIRESFHLLTLGQVTDLKSAADTIMHVPRLEVEARATCVAQLVVSTAD